MKITNIEISEYKKNRDQFNKYYKDALLDILLLKHNFKMSIKEIQNSTSYDINFIVHVIQNYQTHTEIDNDDSYDIRFKLNKYNINTEELKKIGYNNAMISDILKPSEKGTTYYHSIY